GLQGPSCTQAQTAAGPHHAQTATGAHSSLFGFVKHGVVRGSLLWAGMTVSDVFAETKKQIAFGGCVVVDGVQGIGLPLPPSFDDFEKITDFLSLDHVFENLSVFRA
ncbi:hypothetical protein, partial [Acidovorax sp. SUPP2825]|uniref:hypothetical protein n=1 Tax=Acidovorax sp. SUPP2825 TaxID=2920879 RepID=UPI0024E157C6